MAEEQTARAGHNSVDPKKIEMFVSRIERLMDEKKAAVEEFNADIKEAKEEAKGEGVNVAALNHVLRERKLERKFLELEHDTKDFVERIRHAIGDLANTPLGQAAIDRATA